MLILIEGVDGVGKTTLAEALRDRITPYGYEVDLRHCGPLRDHPLNAYELPLDTFKTGGDHVVIYDRHAWGELVYGPALRGSSRLDLPTLLHIELVLKARGAVMILLTASLDVIRPRLAARGEDLITPEMLPGLVAGYGWLRGHSVLDPVVLTNPAEVDAAKLVVLAQHRAHDAGTLVPFPSYIGAPRPEVLLLGDEPGPPSTAAAGEFRACFTPFSGTSGHYLMTTLLHTPLLPALAIVNTKDLDLNRLMSVIGRPQVVALGQKASERARAVGVRHARVDHPQFVRRFHWNDLKDYALMITKAAEVGRGDFTWKS